MERRAVRSGCEASQRRSARDVGAQQVTQLQAAAFKERIAPKLAHLQHLHRLALAGSPPGGPRILRAQCRHANCDRGRVARHHHRHQVALPKGRQPLGVDARKHHIGAVAVATVRGAHDELGDCGVLELHPRQQLGRAPQRHHSGHVAVALPRRIEQHWHAVMVVHGAARRGGQEEGAHLSQGSVWGLLWLHAGRPRRRPPFQDALRLNPSTPARPAHTRLLRASPARRRRELCLLEVARLERQHRVQRRRALVCRAPAAAATALSGGITDAQLLTQSAPELFAVGPANLAA